MNGAMEEKRIKVWADRIEFINNNAVEEKAFRSWLLGETDVMPEKMPTDKYVIGFPHRKNVEICYLSKVCTFTERRTARRYAYSKISKFQR